MRTIKQITLALLIILLGIGTRSSFAQENKLIMTIPSGLPTFVGGENKNVVVPIEGDLIGGGRNINIESEILGDAYIGGGEVNFAGSVEQDLIIAGGKVYISGRVGKNLIVGGGKVIIEEGAMVGGYVLAGGGEVEIYGQLEGSVRVGTGKLTVGETAFIGGNLEADVEKAMIADTSQVVGEKKVNIHKVEPPKVSETGKDVMRGVAAVGKIIYFLSKLVTLLLLVLIAGKLMTPAGALLTKFWTTLGWGMVVTIVTPFVMMILVMSVLGIPLSIITFGVYLLTLYLSSLVVAMALGNVISKNGWLPVKNNYLISAIGLIVISVLTNIPQIGWLMGIVVCFLGMGIIFKLATDGKNTNN